MDVKDFILKILDEGKDYLKVILPVLLAIHIPAPQYGKAAKKEEG